MSAARSSSARLFRRYSSAAIEGDGEGKRQGLNSTACNAKRQSSRSFLAVRRGQQHVQGNRLGMPTHIKQLTSLDGLLVGAAALVRLARIQHLQRGREGW